MWNWIAASKWMKEKIKAGKLHKLKKMPRLTSNTLRVRKVFKDNFFNWFASSHSVIKCFLSPSITKRMIECIVDGDFVNNSTFFFVFFYWHFQRYFPFFFFNSLLLSVSTTVLSFISPIRFAFIWIGLLIQPNWYTFR